MSHNEDDKGDIGKQDNKNGTFIPDKTEKDKEDYCKFSFEGFMDHIETDEKENVVPTIAVGGEGNTITWIPTTPIVIGQEAPRTSLDDTLSHDISKLWLSQPHLDDLTVKKNDGGMTSDLFSIIKIEEEHAIISETIKQYRQTEYEQN